MTRAPRLTRVAIRLGQAWCGLTTGHHYLRQPTPDRLELRCWYCDHVSPGWILAYPKEHPDIGAALDEERER